MVIDAEDVMFACGSRCYWHGEGLGGLDLRTQLTTRYYMYALIVS